MTATEGHHDIPKLTRAQKKMLDEAIDLERRAASLTHTIASISEEQTSLLVRAQLLRMRIRGSL